ncbi:MAG TPA: alpha/beta hydrolase [Syntrophorhabdaceae bacterium]|jgi:acetyl esterase
MADPEDRFDDKIDPETKAFLEAARKAELPPLSRETYVERRRFVDVMALKTSPSLKGIKSREDRTIHGSEGEIPVRVYTPEGEGPFPVLLFFHGGGWVVGSLAMEEHVCLALAEKTPCLVLSVDYRLAPEHPFPAGLHDCYDAFLWARAEAHTFGGDGERIALSGESAGANLAAALTLLARDRGVPAAALQVLFNPVTDLTSFNTASHRKFARGFILSLEDMEATRSLYVPREEDLSDPYVSPLCARSLRGLPSALVITSGFDPLRDEGEAYAKRLKDEGVQVRLIRYKDTIHGFIYFLRSSENTKDALKAASDALREAFGT